MTPDLAATLLHYGVEVNEARESNQKRSCPLHEDHDPSMSVNLGKQLWRCFSCGEAGDAIKLIMSMEGVEYQRAIEISSALGLPTGSTGRSRGSVRSSRYGRRGGVVGGSRDHRGDRPYRPSWGRR